MSQHHNLFQPDSKNHFFIPETTLYYQVGELIRSTSIGSFLSISQSSNEPIKPILMRTLYPMETYPKEGEGQKSLRLGNPSNIDSCVYLLPTICFLYLNQRAEKLLKDFSLSLDIEIRHALWPKMSHKYV